jgi:nicotinamide-nucleotide amidase
MKNPAQKLAAFLKKNELTCALAESMTCGLGAHRLGGIADASDFFKGSIVCYAEEVKTNILKVKISLIKKHTAESQEVTDMLARNLKTLMDADVCAAITGLAAPGGSESKSKPVGTVFFAFYFKRKLHRMRKKFSGNPAEIKAKACNALFNFITEKAS